MKNNYTFGAFYYTNDHNENNDVKCTYSGKQINNYSN